MQHAVTVNLCVYARQHSAFHHQHYFSVFAVRHESPDLRAHPSRSASPRGCIVENHHLLRKRVTANPNDPKQLIKIQPHCEVTSELFSKRNNAVEESWSEGTDSRSAFYEASRYNSASTELYFSETWIHATISHLIPLTFTLPSHLQLCLPWGIFLQFFRQKICAPFWCLLFVQNSQPASLCSLPWLLLISSFVGLNIFLSAIPVCFWRYSVRILTEHSPVESDFLECCKADSQLPSTRVD